METSGLIRIWDQTLPYFPPEVVHTAIQDGETGLNVASRLPRMIGLAVFVLFPGRPSTHAEFLVARIRAGIGVERLYVDQEDNNHLQRSTPPKYPHRCLPGIQFNFQLTVMVGATEWIEPPRHL